MTTDEQREEGVERLLRDASWVEQTNPVDLDGLSRRLRRRRTTSAVLVGVAAVVVTSALGILMTQTGIGSDGSGPEVAGGRSTSAAATGTTDATGGVIPWTDVTPTSGASDAPKPCNPDSLTLSLGQTGAWHDMATQVVTIANSSDAACTVAAKLTVSAIVAESNAASADGSGLPKQPVVLDPQQEATLLVGAPGGCSDSVIAKRVSVTIGDGPAVELDGAWVPVSCGKFEVISLQPVGVAPETEDIPLDATIEAPDTVKAGTVADFRITLTNNSKQPIQFDDCPSYDVGLKASGVLETYLLNCEAAGPIPAGQSAVFQMKVTIPETAAGSDELSWALAGYPAVVSAPIEIK